MLAKLLVAVLCLASGAQAAQGSHCEPATDSTCQEITWFAAGPNKPPPTTTAKAGNTLKFSYTAGTKNAQLVRDEQSFNDCDFSGATRIKPDKIDKMRYWHIPADTAPGTERTT